MIWLIVKLDEDLTAVHFICKFGQCCVIIWLPKYQHGKVWLLFAHSRTLSPGLQLQPGSLSNDPTPLAIEGQVLYTSLSQIAKEIWF